MLNSPVIPKGNAAFLPNKPALILWAFMGFYQGPKKILACLNWKPLDIFSKCNVYVDTVFACLWMSADDGVRRQWEVLLHFVNNLLWHSLGQL